ncbi:hypothetical protein [Streptomyces cupreus]|uniref:Uncharacterized protein n=1 Tax=Streptomyces cupreus TaxID=2759956 RepID=A0A7X1J416_9ACTN|nr:hypothetical protein [Streptomyces cupreus]
MQSRVEATVISALASAHGIEYASSGTVAPETSPTPPPHTTNRAKDASADVMELPSGRGPLSVVRGCRDQPRTTIP